MFVLILLRLDTAVLHEAFVSRLMREAAAATFRQYVSKSFMVPIILADSAALVSGVVGVCAGNSGAVLGVWDR